MPHKRIAFYPCCADDFEESYVILSELVDEVIYCDLNKNIEDKFNKNRSFFPKAKFVLKDAIEAIDETNIIDVFFYRSDSNGEGGSSIYFFGDKLFPLIISKLNKNGALIISDGSNARGSNWRKMSKKDGVELYGRFFKLTEEQKYFSMRGNGPLLQINVSPKNI
jgi:hypothetical protein